MDGVELKFKLVIPTVEEIKKEINKIKDIVENQRVDIKFNISSDALKGLEQIGKQASVTKSHVHGLEEDFGDLEDRLESTGKKLRETFKFDSKGNLKKQIEEFEVELGKVETIYSRINKKGELVTTGSKETTNYKKQTEATDNLTASQKRLLQQLEKFKSIPDLKGLISQTEGRIKGLDISNLTKTNVQNIKNEIDTIKLLGQEIDKITRKQELEAKQQEKNIKSQQQLYAGLFAQIEKTLNSQSGKLNSKNISSTNLQNGFNAIVGNRDTSQYTKQEQLLQSWINRYKNIINNFNEKNKIGIQIDQKSLNNLNSIENKIKGFYNKLNLAQHDSHGFDFKQFEQISAPFNALDKELLKSIPLLKDWKLLYTSGLQQTKDYIKITQHLRQGSTLQDVGIYVDKATGNVHKFNEMVKDTTVRTWGLGAAIKTAFEKAMTWTVTMGGMYSVINKFQEGFSFILEQNKMFTNLQMEMTNTNLDFNELTKSANEYATAMGSTTDEVMKGISVFGTYTSTLQETLQKTKAATILSNLTAQNMETSSDALLGTLQQFKLSAEQSMHVVDILAGTARLMQTDYPVAVKAISDGLRTVGSVAKNSGLSLEQTSGIIAQLVDTTRRSGKEVGNAFKTILTNLGNVDGKLDPKKIKGVEKAFNAVGLTAKATSTTLKPAGQIIEELAGKWSKLNDMEKNNLAQNIAGKYRRNYFLVMMDSYDKAKEKIEGAYNSEGVAMEKNKIFSESLTASLNRLQDAWQRLYLTSSNTDMWKTVIDSGTLLLNTFTDFASLVGGIPAIITTATVAISLFSIKAREGFLSTLMLIAPLERLGKLRISPTFDIKGIGVSIPLFDNLKTRVQLAREEFARLGGGLAGAKGAFQGLTIGIEGFTIASKLATAATVVFQGVLTLGLSMAITYLTTKLLEYVDARQNANQKEQEYFETTKNAIATLKSETIEAGNLLKEYEKLPEPIAQTTEQKQKMAEIQERLASLFPEAITGYNNEGKAIASNIELIKQANKLKEHELELKRKDIADKYKVNGTNKAQEIKNQQKELDDIIKQKNEKMKDYNETLAKSPVELGLTEKGKESKLRGLSDEITNLINKSSELRTAFNKNDVEITDMRKSFLLASETGRKLGSETISLLVNNLGKLKNIDIENLIPKLTSNSNFADQYLALSKTMQKMANSTDVSKKQTELYDAQLQAVINTLSGLGVKGNEISTVLNGLFNLPQLENVNVDTNNLSDSLSGLANQINTNSQQMAVYTKLLEMNAKGKKLSAEEANRLIKNDSVLSQVLQIQNGHVKINVEALNALVQAKVNDANVTVSSENTILKVLAMSLSQKLQIGMAELNMINTLAQARAKAAGIAAKQTVAPKGVFALGESPLSKQQRNDQIKKETDRITNELKPYVDAKNALSKIQQQAKNIKVPKTGVSGGTKGSGGSGSKSSSPKTSKSSTQVEIEKFTSALAKAKTEYAEMTNLLSRKTKLGIVSGFEAFQEKFKNQESYVQKLFDIPSDLDQKLKDYQAKLGKYKSSSKEYKLIKEQISKINKEKATTLKLQETEIQKLKTMQKTMVAMQYKTSMWTHDLKVAVGILKGFDIGKDKLDILKQKIDGLLDLLNDVNNQIKENEEKIKANDKTEEKLLAKRKKTKKGSKEYKELTDEINELIKKNKKLEEDNKKLNNTRKDGTNELKKTNKEYNTSEEYIKKIEDETQKLKDKIQEIVDKIKDIGTSFKDSIKDVGTRLSLNSKFGTDLFGDTEEFFNNITDAYKEKILGFEKFKEMVANSNTAPEVAKKIRDLMIKQRDIGLTTEEKTELTDLINGNEDIKKALEENKLTTSDITDKNFQAIVDVINKQKEETKIVEENIKKYEKKIDALDKQLETQEEINQEQDRQNELQEKFNQLKERQLKISEIQAEIDNVMKDKRFELITEQGQKTLTYDTAKVTDLEQQKADAQKEVLAAQKDIDDFNIETERINFRKSIENQKQEYEDKIKAEQDKLDEDNLDSLVNQHKRELQTYVDQWKNVYDGKLLFETSLNEVAQIGATDRNKIIEDEIKNKNQILTDGVKESLKLGLFELIQQRTIWGAYAKNAFEAGKAIYDAYQKGKSGSKSYTPIKYSYADPNKIYQAPSTVTNNSTVVNIGDIKLEGEKAQKLVDVLQYMGLVNVSNA